MWMLASLVCLGVLSAVIVGLMAVAFARTARRIDESRFDWHD